MTSRVFERVNEYMVTVLSLLLYTKLVAQLLSTGDPDTIPNNDDILIC